MDPLKIKATRTSGPEAKIQTAITKKLESLSWVVVPTHGNEFQMGLPDLYCAHKRYGTRWVEVKNPLAYSFTPAQLDLFPQLTAAGVGIWILISDSDWEYNKLFSAPNWYTYLK